MVKEASVSCFITVLLILTISSFCFGVDPWKIEEVRNKGILDDEDFQIIDSFVEESVQELIGAKDFTDMARIRVKLLSRSSSNSSSSRAQYRKQFYKSAHEYISAALEWAERLEDPDKKLVEKINLLILVEGLRDVQLADLVLDKLTDSNMAIRYWAVNSVCNAEVIEQINAMGAEGDRLTGQIVSRLASIVETSDDSIVAMIARFAAGIKAEQGTGLLLNVADMRIKQYAGWSVENELLDAVILQSLYRKLAVANPKNGTVAQRFGQLYSFVIQRYIKGEEQLNVEQKQKLVSVIVEIEAQCISKLFGPQGTIKRAIEARDFEGLKKEHNLLLGNSDKEGRLGAKFNFRYRHPDGSESVEPVVLPAPSG
jgi:hypothetical protein